MRSPAREDGVLATATSLIGIAARRNRRAQRLRGVEIYDVVVLPTTTSLILRTGVKSV